MNNEDNPILPNVRVPFHGVRPEGMEGFEDRDNFVRDLVTIIGPSISAVSPLRPDRWNSVSVPLSGRAADDAVVTLDQIKMHLRIELDVTVEDTYLTDLEKAARIHTANVLQRVIDATVGENVKQALLVLIAHFYRNRESTSVENLKAVPMAYDALLSPERDFPCY